MKAKGKSVARPTSPHPIWVYGEYVNIPPVKPNQAPRPKGHYIDKGGYPGANVYEISEETLCKDTGATDKLHKAIYEKDILLWETAEEIAYFIVGDQGEAIDILYGEIVRLNDLKREDIKVIGNLIDSCDFVESIIWHMENNKPIPYVPRIDIQLTSYPFMTVKCDKCGKTSLSCRYMGHCPSCGGFATVGYATKVYREKEKAFA